MDYDLSQSQKNVTKKFEVFKNHDTLFMYVILFYFLHCFVSNIIKLFRYMTKSLMCNYRQVLNQIEYFSPSQQFDDYHILFNLHRYSIIYWLFTQSAIWDGKFRPEMTEFLGRSGYGIAFNMMDPEKMFKNG